MKSLFSWLISIDSSDEELRRRGRNLVILALGLIALVLLFILLTAFQPGGMTSQIMMATSVLIYVGVLVLARRGLVSLGALIFTASLIVTALLSCFVSGGLSIIPFFLVLPMLIAGLTLRPRQIWLVLAANVVGLMLTIVALPNNPLNDPSGYITVASSAPLLGVVALMSFLGAQSTSSALRDSQRARSDVETAAHALKHTNADLETKVTERTADLQTALAEVQARADEQTRLLTEVEQQRNTIRELSIPVIPISATTLIMPLVGALDGARMLQLQEQALQSLQRSRARHLVLDITGVPVVDSQVAQGLLAVVQAARLLGTSALLVGIRPEVAQAIVGLGLNFQDMYTASDLQTALNHITT